MAKIGIGLDIGTHATKVMVGRMTKDYFTPLKAEILKGGKEGPEELNAFLKGLGIQGSVVMGVTGRDMIIRYTQVPPMPDWQLRQVMGFEIQDLAAQSGGDLSADFNRLAVTSSLSEDDTILLTLIKNSLLEEYTGFLAGTKMTVAGFTPNSIALYNLLHRTAEVDQGTSLILGMGAENIDLAIIQDGSLIFARNLTGGSNLFNQALMDSFNVSHAKAEKVKQELGCVIARQSRESLSPQQEKVGRSLATAAGQIYSMIQSSLIFCKAQIKVADLDLDKVFLTGGGSRLKGIDAYLSDNLGVPVELYDPAGILDTSSLHAPSTFTQKGLEFSSAVGLALMSATPDHYSIQVLPEEVKKRQYFRSHTLFGILAAVVLVVFLGVKFYLAMSDSEILERDLRNMKREMTKRDQRASEMVQLTEENERLIAALNQLDEKIIPATGLARTFNLVQKYLPEDLWIQSIRIDRVDMDQLRTGGQKKPVIRVDGNGRQMQRSLDESFSSFREKVQSDPLTEAVAFQKRRGENFPFTLWINCSALPEEETAGEEEEDDAEY